MHLAKAPSRWIVLQRAEQAPFPGAHQCYPSLVSAGLKHFPSYKDLCRCQYFLKCPNYEFFLKKKQKTDRVLLSNLKNLLATLLTAEVMGEPPLGRNAAPGRRGKKLNEEGTT